MATLRIALTICVVILLGTVVIAFAFYQRPAIVCYPGLSCPVSSPTTILAP